MPFSNLFVKKVVQDLTSGGIDWQREKWQSGLGSKFIHQGEKNAAKYADEVIVLSKGVQDYFKETYGRKTHFIPNGVNRPQIREASLITDKFGLKKDSYTLFLGRLVPEKGIRYLVEQLHVNLKFLGFRSDVPEVDITSTSKFLSLNMDAAIWAKNIMECKGKERVDSLKLLKQEGYDIEDTAHMVENFYLKIQN